MLTHSQGGTVGGWQSVVSGEKGQQESTL